MKPGGSAKEGPHACGGRGGGRWGSGAAHLYVFYVSGRLRGARDSALLRARVGPLKKDLTCVGGSELGSYEDLMNVLRILASGCSFCCVLQGSEGLGGPDSSGAVALGGSAKEAPHVI